MRVRRARRGHRHPRAQEGTTPQAIVDRYHGELRTGFERFGMSFDVYGRTTCAMHRATSQAMFAAIEAAGGFVQRTQRQPFDPEAGMFLADRFIRGTCPVCGYTDAYGDQCEHCGSTLAPEDLIEPRSALSRRDARRARDAPLVPAARRRCSPRSRPTSRRTPTGSRT